MPEKNLKTMSAFNDGARAQPTIEQVLICLPVLIGPWEEEARHR